jgi:hypothetical protein
MYMLRPDTHEIHVQPYHIFDIHWSYNAGLDARATTLFALVCPALFLHVTVSTTLETFARTILIGLIGRVRARAR